MNLQSNIDKELKKLAAMQDESIDTSDSPEISAEEWRKRGLVGKFYTTKKLICADKKTK